MIKPKNKIGGSFFLQSNLAAKGTKRMAKNVAIGFIVNSDKANITPIPIFKLPNFIELLNKLFCTVIGKVPPERFKKVINAFIFKLVCA